MMQFYQYLIPPLQIGQRKRHNKIEKLQRAFLRAWWPARFRLGLAVVIHETERIMRPALRGAPAERPSRALPDRVAADLRFDLRLAHAAVVVPGRIISADV